jgi:hypothetical protein
VGRGKTWRKYLPNKEKMERTEEERWSSVEENDTSDEEGERGTIEEANMGEIVLEPCSKGGEESVGSAEEGDESSRRDKKRRGMVKCKKAKSGPRKRGSIVKRQRG